MSNTSNSDNDGLTLQEGVQQLSDDIAKSIAGFSLTDDTAAKPAVSQSLTSDGIGDPAQVEIMKLAFGNSCAVLFDNGRILTRLAKGEVDQSSYISYTYLDAVSRVTGVNVNRDSGILNDCINLGGFTWKCGMCIVTGPAAAGKSPVLKWFKDSAPDSTALVRFGEPLPGYLTLDAEAAYEIMRALINPAVRVIAIDSMKDLLVSMSYGGTMARGIPRAIFRFMSQLGAIAAALGKLVVVPLNISTDNADAIKEVTEAVYSNSTCALIGSGSGEFALSQRNGESKLRTTGHVVLSFDKDGAPSIKVTTDDSTGLTKARDVSRTMQFSSDKPLVNDVVAMMMKRAAELQRS